MNRACVAAISIEGGDYLATRLRIDDEHKETAASGTRDFATERSVLVSRYEEIIDHLGRDILCGRSLRLPGVPEDRRHAADVSGKQRLFHRDCIGFELVQAIERLSIISINAAHLLLNDHLGSARLAGEADDDRRFEFVQVGVANPKRIDDDPFLRQELDEVDAAKSRRVLILPAAGQTQIDAFSTRATTRVEDEPRPDPGGASTVEEIVIAGTAPFR
jgi:hypothetical protein